MKFMTWVLIYCLFFFKIRVFFYLWKYVLFDLHICEIHFFHGDENGGWFYSDLCFKAFCVFVFWGEIIFVSSTENRLGLRMDKVKTGSIERNLPN